MQCVKKTRSPEGELKEKRYDKKSTVFLRRFNNCSTHRNDITTVKAEFTSSLWTQWVQEAFGREKRSF